MKFTLFSKKNKSNSTKTSKDDGMLFPQNKEEKFPFLMVAIPMIFSNLLVFYLSSSPSSEKPLNPLQNLKNHEEFITSLKLKTPFEKFKKIKLKSPKGEFFSNIYFLSSRADEKKSFLEEEEGTRTYTLFVPSQKLPELMKSTYFWAIPHTTPQKAATISKRKTYEITY